jgi:alginate O-acetyltransferase complex protein AlgI
MFLAVYFILPVAVRRFLILAGGLVFTTWASLGFAVVLLFSVMVNHQFGIMLDRQKMNSNRKLLFVSAIILNLAALLLFKYAVFLTENINVFNALFGVKALPLPEIFLPLGISFYTFRILSYFIDLYTRKIAVEKSLTDLAVYITFFPQLSAGPIVRYRNFYGKGNTIKPGLSNLHNGARRFLFGLVKKALLANSFGIVADAVFVLPPEEYTLTTAWLGVISYSLQIYFDFSAYTDMAIGLSEMLGFRTPENFNYPYKAVSVKDFWRRWHMTLTSWFRDYLFLPLAMNFSRKMPASAYLKVKSEIWIYVFSTAITWSLVGFWHGASWTFIVWGLIYGLFLVFEQIGLEKKMRKIWRPLRHFYTMLVVVIAWVFFRADSFQQAFEILKGMSGRNGIFSETFEYYRYVTPGFIVAMIIAVAGASGWLSNIYLMFWKSLVSLKSKHKPIYLTAYRFLMSALLFSLVYLAVAELLKGDYTPFIYIRF